MAVIPYEDVIDRQPLPIDAQNVVTKVRLVIAGDLAGSEPDWLTVRFGSLLNPAYHEYAPEPITFVYEAPEHATYAAERSFALPSGVNPFLPPTDPLINEPGAQNFVNPGAPSAVRDGDPTTAAERADLGEGPGGSNIGWMHYFYRINPSENLPRIWGYRLRYFRVGGEWVELWLQQRAFQDDASAPFHQLDAGVRPPVSSGEGPEDLYLVLPQDAAFNPVNNSVEFTRLDGHIELRAAEDTELRIVDFYPLILNEPLLLDIARAQIRLPALNPQRVTVRGVVPPDREHTIVGWPGGDYTARVAQQQYELGRTVIDFEQAGSPAGLPAEAIEAARERRQAIEGTVATANYNLMMGSRR